MKSRLKKKKKASVLGSKYAKLAIIAFIFANSIWGAAAPIYKWSFADLHIYTLAFLRFAIPAFIIGILFFKYLKIKVKDIPFLILLGLCDIGINVSIYFFALSHTASINGPIIGSAGPVFLIIGSILFLKEKPTRKLLLGNLIGLTGILLIVVQPLLQPSSNNNLFGNLLLIAATISSTCGTILAKKIRPHYHTVTVLFWSFTFGSIALFPFFANDVIKYGLLPHLTSQGLLGLSYATLASSTMAYTLYYWAVRYIVASEISIFSYMDPVVAIFIAGPLLNEHPTIIFFLGALMVFAGIYVAEGRIHYHPVHKLFK